MAKDMIEVNDTMDLLKSFMEQMMKDKIAEPEALTLGVDAGVTRPPEGPKIAARGRNLTGMQKIVMIYGS